MKKKAALTLALILALLLALSASACAEDWQAQLADYSLEELQALAAACDAEIVRRTTESFDVPTGTYIIGEDIPAGTYRIERLANSAAVKVWPSAALAADPYAYSFYEGLYMDDPVIGKLQLVAGNILVLDAAVRFSLYQGISAW